MKDLVIYFSREDENYFPDGLKILDVGNTSIVVSKIQKLIDCDVFRVESESLYPIEYDDCCRVALEELNLNLRPELKEYINDIDKYNTIYIGSPIWWNHLPMPMLSCLEKLDFKNHNVKYFDTHEGSGMGHIKNDILEYCKNANIIDDGLAIKGSEVNKCDEILKEWILKDHN